MFFQFQNKAARDNRLEKQKSKRSLSVVYYITVSVLTFDLEHSFLEVAKISYQTLVMLTKVLRFEIFFFCICMLCMLCMRR